MSSLRHVLTLKSAVIKIYIILRPMTCNFIFALSPKRAEYIKPYISTEKLIFLRKRSATESHGAKEVNVSD